MSKTLLIVHHTPSPHTQEMFEAVVAGATDPEIEGVEVVRRPALTVSPVEMLEADGYLLGSPANLGYISGALKHAFDCAYYQLLDSTRGRPFGLYLHGNEGTEEPSRASPPSPPGWAGSKPQRPWWFQVNRARPTSRRAGTSARRSLRLLMG